MKNEEKLVSPFCLSSGENYSSPPCNLRINNPQAKPTKVRTIRRIAPLNNILSAVMFISPGIKNYDF
jgi:hypothetical protein